LRQTAGRRQAGLCPASRAAFENIDHFGFVLQNAAMYNLWLRANFFQSVHRCLIEGAND